MRDVLKDRKNIDDILYIISNRRHPLGKSKQVEINKRLKLIYLYPLAFSEWVRSARTNIKYIYVIYIYFG